jgi:CRISPR-associated protein Csb3
MKYDIQVNPYNPVEYLACCGVLEILARFDANAVSWWELHAQPRCRLESQVDEAALLHCLTQTLTDWSSWQTSGSQMQEIEEQDSDVIEEPSDETDDANAVEESNEGILLSPSFHLNDHVVTLRLDWWYETLRPNKTIKEKSAWKMYAGQQTAEKISGDMTGEAAKLLQQNQVANISALLRLSAGMTGRFGFDPRSSRNALDAGYSANDLKLPIATYTFAEMLAAIGAHYFFAHRTRQGGGITSARGWVTDDAFQYALWQTPLPIALARLAATGIAIQRDQLILLEAGRARRDKYANFKMAKTAVWPDVQAAEAKNKARL